MEISDDEREEQTRRRPGRRTAIEIEPGEEAGTGTVTASEMGRRVAGVVMAKCANRNVCKRTDIVKILGVPTKTVTAALADAATILDMVCFLIHRINNISFVNLEIIQY